MEKQINNIVINAIPIKGLNNKRPRGHEIFEIVSPNIALIAKKKSGKSNLLYHILKKCVGNKTKFHIFCSSAYTDPVYRDMIDYFKKRGNKMDVNIGLYTTDESGKRKRKINILGNLLKKLEKDAIKEANKKQKGKGKKKKKPTVNINYDNFRKRSPFERRITFNDLPTTHVAYRLFPNIMPQESAEINVPETQEEDNQNGSGCLNEPSRVFIFDDLSNELNDPIIAKLLKNIRH